jgi:hypothetical protein
VNNTWVMPAAGCVAYHGYGPPPSGFGFTGDTYIDLWACRVYWKCGCVWEEWVAISTTSHTPTGGTP